MKNKKIIRGLIVIPPLIAVFLGWMDYEVTSLSNLFSEPGNIIALLLYTVVFQMIGSILVCCYFSLKPMFK
ncbi:MAG: hypothetical protein AB8G15_05880 [Saprospiraceae bacterium]